VSEANGLNYLLGFIAFVSKPTSTRGIAANHGGRKNFNTRNSAGLERSRIFLYFNRLAAFPCECGTLSRARLNVPLVDGAGLNEGDGAAGCSG